MLLGQIPSSLMGSKVDWIQSVHYSYTTGPARAMTCRNCLQYYYGGSRRMYMHCSFQLTVLYRKATSI